MAIEVFNPLESFEAKSGIPHLGPTSVDLKALNVRKPCSPLKEFTTTPIVLDPASIKAEPFQPFERACSSAKS